MLSCIFRSDCACYRLIKATHLGQVTAPDIAAGSFANVNATFVGVSPSASMIAVHEAQKAIEQTLMGLGRRADASAKGKVMEILEDAQALSWLPKTRH